MNSGAFVWTRSKKRDKMNAGTKIIISILSKMPFDLGNTPLPA